MKIDNHEINGILPVINIPNVNLAIPVAEALRRGGVNSIEVTLRSPDSLESIKSIKTEFPDMTVGAGTVLSVELVDKAIANGADFIVTPGYDDKVVDYCIAKGIQIVPGCVTATEIQKAVASGLKTLKFFPAELNGGVEAINLLSGPFPSVKFIPTGGITFQNLGKYLKSSKVLACGGSYMATKSQIDNGDFDSITEACKKAVAISQGFEPVTPKKRTNEEWRHIIIDHRVCVSDTANLTSSSAPISCFDPERGMLYTPYHAGRGSYGEQFSTMMLMKMPIMQPQRAENFVLIDSGDVIDGVTYINPVDASSIFIDGKVRIYFLANSSNYYYLDFDPATNAFSKIEPVLCKFDGSAKAVELTKTAANKYLTQNGMEGFNLDFDPRENIINVAKPCFYEGAYYGCITSGCSQPIIWKCTDGTTFEFQGIVPKIASYECQIAICNGDMYALLRGAKDCNYYVSHDLGKTFCETPTRVPMEETRPQLLEYGGKVLMAYSAFDIKPNLLRRYRNNIRLLLGSGEDFSKYKEIFAVSDKYGIVYYDIINYKGELFMLWSNSELYPDKKHDGCLRGKDALFYARLGDLDDYTQD